MGTENTTTNGTSRDASYLHKYISDHVFFYVSIAIQTVLSGGVSIVGVVTNVITIVVFVRQGVLSDSSTVTLLGLAVADLLSTTTMLWLSVTFCVAMNKPPGLSWEPYDIMYMSGGFPHLISTLIQRMITALLALERCLCVVLPFTVKSVFTPRRSLIFVACIFTYFILTYSPAYVLNTFHYVTDPESNLTRLVLVEDPRWQYVQFILGYGNLYTLNFTSVVVVLVSTTITISRVKLSKAWRESMSNGNVNSKRNEKSKTEKEGERILDINPEHGLTQTDTKLSISKMQKEKKLVRMITVISVLFLVCYLPNIALTASYSYDNDIRTDGPYSKLAWILHSVPWFTETINSSVNIFIYYKMSTRFRKGLNSLLGLDEK